MASETSVATAALAIAISALVIAAGQLVAQLFSTADGYRRCQRSIIGDWYELVVLKFRWSSFRYEVKVTTPHFEIATMLECEHRASFYRTKEETSPKYMPWYGQKTSRSIISPSKLVALLGTPDSLYGTFCLHEVPKDQNWLRMGVGQDMPTWFELLQDVHQLQNSDGWDSVPSPFYEDPNKPALICISRMTRSWDFMPPDIVRPVASTTLGCLITMAYRLNMRWVDFRPNEGSMRAMGGGRSFSTSIVRGMGLVVEYNTSIQTTPVGVRIPSYMADKLAFGRIPQTIFSGHHVRDISLRNEQSPGEVDVVAALYPMQLSSAARKALEASVSHQDPAHRLPAFTDILGILCDCLPIEGNPVRTIENPFPFPLTTMGERIESREVWRTVLKKRGASLSEACERVLHFYDAWAKDAKVNTSPRYLPSYESDTWRMFFRQAYDTATEYLYKKNEFLGGCEPHENLVPSHIEVNAHSLQQAEENIRNGHDKTRETDSLPKDLDPIFTERAYIYVENIPKFVEEMERRIPSGARFSYEDVWWMMMMRLHAWTMSVRWVDSEGVKIPSEYYDNPARVYIL